jgi:hypothetical protein
LDGTGFQGRITNLNFIIERLAAINESYLLRVDAFTFLHLIFEIKDGIICPLY